MRVRNATVILLALLAVLIGYTLAPSSATADIPGYVQVSAEFPATPTGSVTGKIAGHVSCPTAQIPTGGGVSYRGSDSYFLATEVVSQSNPTANGWDGALTYNSNTVTTSSADVLIVYAVCADET